MSTGSVLNCFLFVNGEFAFNNKCPVTHALPHEAKG
jgi:hypothetical protein